jgi:hypothetical protein
MLQFSSEDEAKYNNWPDMLVDTSPPIEFNTALIASIDFSHTAALFAHTPEPAIFLDSGATAHISCIQNDFKTLHTIVPHKISGVGDSMVFAISIGTMTLTLPSTNRHLELNNVLFTPTSGVWLVSIAQLDIHGFSIIFANRGCRITNRAGQLVADRTLMQSMLYTLSSPSTQTSNNIALLALFSPLPDLKSWHCHLSHINFCTVLDMACGNAVTGMKTNLSPIPSTCDTCVRGKQTQNPIPKLCEGPRSLWRLE